MLQQAIGEPARRGADVGADPRVGLHTKCLKGGLELEPSPADVAHGLTHVKVSVRRYETPRLVSHDIAQHDFAGEDQALRLGSALCESLFDQQLIQPLFRLFQGACPSVGGPGIAASMRCRQVD